MKAVYQPLFEQNTVPVFFLGAVLALGSVVNVIFVKYSYTLEDYLSFKNILLLLYGLMAIIYIVMGLYPTPIVLVCGYILLQGLYTSPEPIISDYIHERTKTSIRSTMISGISLGKQGMKVIMRVLLGIVVGVVTIPNTLVLLGIYILIALGISYRLVSRCGCVYKIVHEEENLFHDEYHN